jgi:prolyl-tRNA editing enzyme YbaK/EbsC (Cys-tRNA(Pro) deacylase)
MEHSQPSPSVSGEVAPMTGHPMGLQNPAGLAQTVAEVLDASWPR